MYTQTIISIFCITLYNYLVIDIVSKELRFHQEFLAGAGDDGTEA